MINKEQVFAMGLNALVTGDKFVNKSLEDYIYASLSQPPIKIIDKNNSDDELDYSVECPNCGSHVIYGTDIFMISGHIYCSNNDCREKLEKELDKRYDRN